MLIITIKNISKTSDIADYEYRTYVNDQPIDGGLVFSHNRSKGYFDLLQKLIDQNTIKSSIQPLTDYEI